jgi:intracellular septation protein
MTKKSHDSTSKFLCDYAPLIVFFIFYKFVKTDNPLITATIFMVATTALALIISYFLTKKISKVALFSGVVLAIFGGLAISLHDEIFIKIKPTAVNLLFATILFYGYFAKKPFLSYLLGEQIKMSDAAWLILSKRWACFFVFLAALNEVIWREFSTDFWVQFKVFGMMPLSLIFTCLQAPFMLKNIKKESV